MEEFIRTIRGYSYFIDNSKIKLILWMETYWGEYRPIDSLSIKRLRTGDFVCKVCNNYAGNLEEGYCPDCYQVDENHQVWLTCLYNRNDSFINTIGCTKADPPCRIPEHIPKCYTRYLLYLGRIGDAIKVGITRKGRLGGLWGRFLEQGLNEAIVVDSLANLPVVAKNEKWFTDLGFPDSIRYNQKVEELLKNERSVDITKLETGPTQQGNSYYLFQPELYRPNLLKEFPMEMWRQKFPGMDVSNILVFPEVGYSQLNLSEHAIMGKVTWFQGSILISSYRHRNYITNLNDIIHREILEIRRG